MREFTFILEFAERYGLKESAVLTEICKTVFQRQERKTNFDFVQIANICPFLTESQLRLALKTLCEKNCLLKFTEVTGHNNCIHKKVYVLDNEIFCKYSEHHKQHIYEQFMKVSGGI